MRRSCGVLVLLVVLSCVRTPPAVLRPPVPGRIAALHLVGESSLPPLERFPPTIGLLFGGISGLAALSGGASLLGISDDRPGTRVYRFRVTTAPVFAVTAIEYFPLGIPAAPPDRLDAEGIAVLSSGRILVASEGIGSEEPRVPPALVEYGPHGEFIRHLPVRDRFIPNPTGPLVRGVRANMGFESLTLAPGGRRLFTATEAALAQDGEMASFERGTRSRILEYVERRGIWLPAREFVYEVEPLQRPSFEPGQYGNGLVELLAIGDDVLLAMERTYVESADDPERGENRIRLYRVDLRGASDVSGLDSLEGAAGVVSVAKTLLLDLAGLPGLTPTLADGLDNFEGLAFGPRLADGRESLILVSDDNFNRSQRTWFLLLAVDRIPSMQQVQ